MKKIKKIIFVFLLSFFINLNFLNSNEVNLNEKYILLKDFIVLKYELFLVENMPNLQKGSGLTHVAYQNISYEVDINKDNKITIILNAIMNKKRYTTKKYKPKLSDCNQIRNKIFTNKYGYSLFKRSLNNMVNSESLSSSINENVLNISSLNDKARNEIINSTYIYVNILHPKKINNISCKGKLNDNELK